MVSDRSSPIQGLVRAKANLHCIYILDRRSNRNSLHSNPRAFRHYWRQKRRQPKSCKRLVNVRRDQSHFRLTTSSGPLTDTLPLSFPADRVQKLKDARSEAAKEIEAYKVQKQKDYEAYEAEVNTIPAFIATGV
jgi:hypothetical protein